MNPLQLTVWVATAVAAICWVLSLVTREYSWVDRIWSIIPVVYVCIFAAATGLADARLDVIAVLVVLWGARLTFNFARKGGYANGGEDYRWRILRQSMRPWQFQIFNLFFISGYQNFILLLIALPASTALEHRTSFGVADVVAGLVFLALLVGETVADQQQWRFHQWKRAEVDAGPEPGARILANRAVPIQPAPQLLL